jgi:hypothetical protein
MKVLTFSRQFPKGHPKAGQPTFFVEQSLNSIMPRGENGIINRSDINPEILPLINDFVLLDGGTRKHHTIRAGNRFKVGDMASLRVWSDKPYRSKQIEFAQVEVKKVWPITIIVDEIFNPIYSGNILIPTCQLAKNDGLECDDFVKWFMIHPKKAGSIFTGQIISWSDSIEY